MNAATAIRNRWRFALSTHAHKISRGEWLPYRHLIHAIDIVWPQILAGGFRGIINMPPRHGKSETFSHRLPSFFLDWFPSKRVINTSYQADVAADWGRKVRDTFEQNDDTMTAVRRDTHASNRWSTTHGGGMVTAGVGGPITGRGADLALCDDPHKNYIDATSLVMQRKNETWWNTTFMTRLEPNASVLLIGTRWSENDLTGYLLREQPDRWSQIILRAIAEDDDPLGRSVGEALCPERYDIDALKLKRDEIGSRAFEAMYQQRPSPEAGAVFQREWLKYWLQLPEKFERVVQSWDLSFKGNATSDYVVGQVWGQIGVDKYLLDQVRGRWGFSDTIGQMRMLNSRWDTTSAVYVEDKANGPAVIDTLRQEISGLIPVNPAGGKMARARSVEPQFEAGNVYFPDPSLYPWVEPLISELLSFPNAANDDQVDTLTQVLLQLSHGFRFLLARAD